MLLKNGTTFLLYIRQKNVVPDNVVPMKKWLQRGTLDLTVSMLDEDSGDHDILNHTTYKYSLFKCYFSKY